MNEDAKVTPSLFVFKSRLFEMNSGVFVNGGDAYLVDPGILSAEISRVLRAVDGGTVAIRGIIITHSHWDHILGPERLPGVPVIAHPRAAEAFAHDAEHIASTVTERLAAEGYARETPFVSPSVDVIVADGLALPCGDRTLRLVHAPGHCSDQLVIYDPLERTLWAADMLSDIEIPFVDDVAAYRRTIERLRALEIATLVPGHGAPTADPAEIQERLAWDHAYLVRLEREVASAVHSHRSLEHAQKSLASWPLRRPDINAREHLRNIETVYRAFA